MSVLLNEPDDYISAMFEVLDRRHRARSGETEWEG